MLVSSLLGDLDWVEHGFGTRHSRLTQDEMASLEQVHSDLTLVAHQGNGCIGKGDALITDRRGVAVSVRSADCFPILLADDRRRVVAAVHAGWRGTVSRLVEHALLKMQAEFGTDAADVYAAIGPGIGVCCYQVGPDVARQFGIDHATRIDLAEANRRLLLASGVREERIDVLGACTCCEAERFYSYRRDRLEAGRMISYIRIAS